MRRVALWLSLLIPPLAVGSSLALLDRHDADPFTAVPWPTSSPSQALATRRPLRPAPPLRRPKAPPPLAYRIDARLDPTQHRVDGALTLTFTNTSRVPLRDLRLHLYLNAFASDDTLFARTSGGVHRGHRRSTRGWIRVHDTRVDGLAATARRVADGTVLAITPSTPIAPRRPLTLTLRFNAKLPRVFARTGYADDFFMLAQWYPKLGVLRPDGTWDCPAFHANAEFFADFARYRLKLTLPRRFVVGHTGVRRARRVIGDQQQLDIEASWVHDLALATWPHFVAHHVDVDGVHLRLLTVPGRGQAARELEVVTAGLRRLDRWFGAYPYAQLTVVDIPAIGRGADAMEYPQLFTVWIPLFAPRGAHAADEVLLHELTHQYFQGLVATNEAEEPWLDEGVTTFISGLLLDTRYGPDRSFVDLGPFTLGQRDKNQLHQAAAAHDEAVAQAARDFPSWRRYGGAVYGRTAAMLYAYDSLVGRARTLRAFRAYVQRNAFKHPTRRDLVRALRRATPPALRPTIDRLFASILDGEGGFEASLSCAHNTIVLDRRGLSLPLWIRWQRAGDRRPHWIRVPEATHAAGSRHGAVTAKPSPSPSRVRFPAPGLVSAALGPPARLLLSDHPLGRRCSRRAGDRGAATHLAPLLELLFAMVTP